MQFEDKDLPHQYGDRRLVPPSSASSPFTVPAPVRPTEQRDREKFTTSTVNNSSLAGHRCSNHDRINTQAPATALSSDGNVQSSKSAAHGSEQPLQIPSAAVDTVVSQPPLRRIKTESGALSMSTKQYFQRKERERLERDAVKSKLTAAVKPAPSDSCCKHQSTDLKTVSDHSVSSGLNMSLTGRHESLSMSAIRGLGMGDLYDQRPANIFESFHVNDSQQADGSLESKTVTTIHVSSLPGSQQTSEVTAVTATDSLDLGAILKPEHVHGGSYSLELPVFTTAVVVASSVAVTTVQSGISSSLSVSYGHQGSQSPGVSSSSVSSDRSRQRMHSEFSPDRRRSARLEGGTSLMSPAKPQHVHQTDQMNASDVSEISRRSRQSKSSQSSPLKMKLSLLSAGSHTGSRTIAKHVGETLASTKLKSLVSRPLLESRTLSVSDSQEHIRLKLNVSSGRVEKVGNAATSQASTSAASGMKLVLSKDKVSGEYQHGAVSSCSSSSETGQHRHHHHRSRHRCHYHHKLHSRPDAESYSAHRRKRAADVDSTLKPSTEKKLCAELLGNGHQSSATRRLSQPQPSQTNMVAITSGLSRTHIPSTYRMSGTSSVVPPPPPLPPLPTEEPAAPPPPPLPPQ